MTWNINIARSWFLDALQQSRITDVMSEVETFGFQIEVVWTRSRLVNLIEISVFGQGYQNLSKAHQAWSLDKLTVKWLNHSTTSLMKFGVDFVVDLGTSAKDQPQHWILHWKIWFIRCGEFEFEWRIWTLRSSDLEFWNYIKVEDLLKKSFHVIKCSKSLRGCAIVECFGESYINNFSTSAIKGLKINCVYCIVSLDRSSSWSCMRTWCNKDWLVIAIWSLSACASGRVCSIVVECCQHLWLEDLVLH